MANPTPLLPLSYPPVAIAVLIPISSPCIFNNAPPLFPGFIAETTVQESVTDGLLIGSIEILTKLIIYYFHERAWRIGWQKQSDAFHHSKKRSLYKAITYRVIGSLDTFIISTFVIKSAKLGGGVAIAEILTKPVLYYIHERIWDKQSIGNK